MFEIKFTKRFKSSHAKVELSGRLNVSKFKQAVDCLTNGEKLPIIFRDHPLNGDVSNNREFHMKGDLVVYEIDHDNKVVRFIDIDNHANLYG